MVSVQQLIDVPELGLVPLHLHDPAVTLRWVATSELADPSPFLEGGEVLLTTGLDSAGWSREWAPYVRRLASAGVVAIGFAVGLTHDRVPPALLKACQRHDVTLLEVPMATPFVAVSRAAAALLQREDESATRRAFELQRELTQAAVRDDEPDALIRQLAAIGAMACTVAADGTVESGPFGARPELFDHDEVLQTLGSLRSRGLRAAATFSTSSGTLLVHPLGVRGRPERYLVTGYTGRVTDVQRSTITTAVALLSMGEERKREVRAAARTLRTRALELLLQGDDHTAALVLRTGPAPRPRLARQVCVIRLAGAEERRDEAWQLLEQRTLLVGTQGEQLVVVAPARSAAGLARELSSYDLRVGIGESTSLAQAPRSAETAAHALELTTAATPVASWELSVGRGILSLVDEDRAASYAVSFLAPLTEDTLVETLRSFLLHHGSHLKVAEDLGIHRNTVRHRVHQIEDALGLSLADPQARMDAWAALSLAAR